MNIPFSHASVMPHEIMSFLKDSDGKIFVDATAGGGGHLSLLAEQFGEAQIFAFDRDPRAHREDASLGVKNRYPRQIVLLQQPFSTIKQSLEQHGIHGVDGLVADLGVSSNQLDDRARGFSFLADGPLDMRMDPTTGMSAHEWLEKHSEQEIADVLFKFGGERKSRAIARRIKETRPLPDSTSALAQLIISAMRQRKWVKIHPATRSFQAIRMAVNGEVYELEALLSDLPKLLNINGVAIFLSFHSVEDRLIKHKFKEMAATKKFSILTKKPLTATDEELTINRRSRSAKLRAIKRIA